MSGIEQSGIQRYTWSNPEKMDIESIGKIIESYISSDELQRLQMYSEYYKGDNTDILKRYKDKAVRNKTLIL